MVGKVRWDGLRKPHEVRGVPYTTHRKQLRDEVARGERHGPAHDAERQAYQEAGRSIPPEYALEAAGDPPAQPSAASLPPAPSKPAPIPAVAPMTRSITTIVPTARQATVGVSYRATVEQHDRLRDISHVTRRPLQDLLREAIDEWLSRQA